MKKLALLLAVILMMTSTIAFAIEGPEADQSLYPLVDEKITVTAAIAYTASMPSDQSEVWIWDYLEEKTGVHLEFINIPTADRATRANLMFQTGDLPDILFKMNVSTTDMAKYGADGLLVDLAQYSDLMPNLNYWYEKYPTAKDAVTQVDDTMYGLPYILTGEAIRMGSKIFYNSEVLEYAGLTEAPTTLDEFYNYLVAIKDFDYDGNGVDDTIPFTTNSYKDPERVLAGSFGLMNRGGSHFWADQNEDGSARFWHTADEYKELLKYLEKLYAEGLLDPDFFTNDWTQMKTKCGSGRALTYIYVNDSAVAGIYDHLTVPMVEPLEGFNGEKMWSLYSLPSSAAGQFCITKNCPEEYREILVQWADYLYSIEGIVKYFMGEEGVSYTYDPETDHYELTDLIMNNELDFMVMISKWTAWAGGANPSCATNELFKGGETFPCSIKAAEGLINYTCEKMEGGAIWAPFTFDTETSSRVSILTSNFEAYLKEWYGYFITGEKDIDEAWDEYVEGFNAVGAEEYIGYIDAKIEELGL